MEHITADNHGIDVFDNDIDLFISMFTEEQNIEDLRTVPQSVWNACLMYVCRHLFKGTNNLKSQTRHISGGNAIPSTHNAYNIETVNNVLDYYIYLCSLYNKEVSIVGFSNLTGIDTDTIISWGENVNVLSPSTSVIYKKLHEKREESLSNKLADGKQNPVGVIAMLNRHYGWASPYTSDARKQQALTDENLPRLGQNTSTFDQIEHKSEDDNG